MAKNSMAFLELLRKRGMDGDVDFLREALQVLGMDMGANRYPPAAGVIMPGTSALQRKHRNVP